MTACVTSGGVLLDWALAIVCTMTVLLFLIHRQKPLK